MATLFSRRKTIVLAITIFVFTAIILFAIFYYHQNSASPTVDSEGLQVEPAKPSQDLKPRPSLSFIFHPTETSTVANIEGWTFDSSKDAENYGLDDKKCDAAFPDMYFEIERAAAFWNSIGNITIVDVDASWKASGLVRAMIYNRRVSRNIFSRRRNDLTNIAVYHRA